MLIFGDPGRFGAYLLAVVQGQAEYARCRVNCQQHWSVSVDFSSATCPLIGRNVRLSREKSGVGRFRRRAYPGLSTGIPMAEMTRYVRATPRLRRPAHREHLRCQPTAPRL